MIFSAINRTAFTIGNLTVEWYGIIITAAMVLGLIYMSFEAKRIGLTKDDALELFLWIIPLAVIFARLLYIIPRADEYLHWQSWSDFVHAFAIWEGGITIIGGILGGLIGALIFWARHRKTVNFGQIIDLVIPVLLLGQVIGRWGNFVNQEAYGIAITDPNLQWFPFAVYIDHCFAAGCTCLGGGWHAATFFYEGLWNFVGVLIAYAIWRKNKKYPGLLGFFYFFWYFLIRALMEYLRLDAVPVTQVACYIIFPLAFVLGIAYMIFCNYYNRKKLNSLNPDKVGKHERYAPIEELKAAVATADAFNAAANGIKASKGENTEILTAEKSIEKKAEITVENAIENKTEIKPTAKLTAKVETAKPTAKVEKPKKSQSSKDVAPEDNKKVKKD